MTMEAAAKKDGRGLSPEDLSIVDDASLVVENGVILWSGKTADLPEKFVNLPAADCSGLVFTPEVVDSHTHTVFGGNRAFEYTMRLNGADYEEIASAGGGILATMDMTKKENPDLLFNTRVVARTTGLT